jgi:hypothetical protein
MHDDTDEGVEEDRTVVLPAGLVEKWFTSANEKVSS